MNNNLFRIVCYVNDPKLAPFYRAAAGLVAHMELPQPVANALVKNGKLEAQTKGVTNGREALLAAVIKLKPKEVIDSSWLINVMKSIGVAANAQNASNYFAKLVEAKVLKRTSPGKYKFIYKGKK